MSIQCSNCGSLNSNDVTFCTNCGSLLSEGSVSASQSDVNVHQKPCVNCQRMFNVALSTCPFCGAVQLAQSYPGVYASSVPSSSHNKTTAALLAILLGGIGIHKFYLGKTLQGIIYILFSWTGIPLILGIIEGIIYLTTNDQAFFEKYG